MLAEAVAARLAKIRARIERAGGDVERVRVLAVTKGFGPEAVRAASASALLDVGENYAAELLEKSGRLAAAADLEGAPPRWHFLGAVQRNKVGALAPVVSCWQSVARLSEGEAIQRAAPGARVLVQVDTTGRPGRNGVGPDAVPGLTGALRDVGLDVVGLMTVAPRPPDQARAAFRAVGTLADRLGLRERSMGMSDDLELAVAEGSTMVRIGRDLFGARPARPALARTSR
ncbi:MAG TPA: YggS family pyridoxal phosphate enzyme [Acidimicrobiales bacterium]